MPPIPGNLDSYAQMLFKNRQEAAMQLVILLKDYYKQNVVVLAIPRGGVPIGCILAKKLHAELDLLMTKKIGAPGNPEFAIGAVGPDFILIENDVAVDHTYLQTESKRIQEQLKSRYALFRGNKSPVPLTGKTVIITDDGIATGRTILAALPAIQKKQPAEIVIATPVCSVQARARLEPLVDQLISCADPDPFIGVGRFYENFEEVTDKEVLSLLQTFDENTTHASKN